MLFILYGGSLGAYPRSSFNIYHNFRLKRTKQASFAKILFQAKGGYPDWFLRLYIYALKHDHNSHIKELAKKSTNLG